MACVSVDAEASRCYKDRLEDWLTGRVLDPDGRFCCAHGPSCRSSVGTSGFAAGQMSYVGDRYAVISGGFPLRVLVVSMQVGDDEAPVTLERRRAQIHSRISERFTDRNQHMMGVTTALRVLFGGEPGDDRSGELLVTELGPVHVLNAYAMANSVLCSNRPGEGREGSPTVTMLRNCAEHLRGTIEILEPTIIHSQGRSGGWSTHRTIERIAERLEWIDEYVAKARIAGNDVVWCSLKHPARNWAHMGCRYLWEVAVPALRKARRYALTGEGVE